MRRRKASKARREISLPITPQQPTQFQGHSYTPSNAGTVPQYHFSPHYAGSGYHTPETHGEVHEVDGNNPLRELDAAEKPSQLDSTTESEVKSNVKPDEKSAMLGRFA